MWSVFHTITTNLGVGIENIVLIIGTFGSVVFFAKDAKLGILMLMFISGGCFMFAYGLGLNYTYSMIVFLCSVVLLTFTLFAVQKNISGGAYV